MMINRTPVLLDILILILAKLVFVNLITDNLHGVLRTSVRECTVNLTCLYQILVGAVHSSACFHDHPQ